MSLLPEPSTFEKRYSDDEKLASELPDRPITSLRDLQYVYGRLYTLATAGGGEYAAYLTPEKSTDLFDEPESLLYLRVDLRETSPPRPRPTDRCRELRRGESRGSRPLVV